MATGISERLLVSCLSSQMICNADSACFIDDQIGFAHQSVSVCSASSDQCLLEAEVRIGLQHLHSIPSLPDPFPIRTQETRCNCLRPIVIFIALNEQSLCRACSKALETIKSQSIPCPTALQDQPTPRVLMGKRMLIRYGSGLAKVHLLALRGISPSD